MLWYKVNKALWDTVNNNNFVVLTVTPLYTRPHRTTLSVVDYFPTAAWPQVFYSSLYSFRLVLAILCEILLCKKYYFIVITK